MNSLLCILCLIVAFFTEEPIIIMAAGLFAIADSLDDIKGKMGENNGSK